MSREDWKTFASINSWRLDSKAGIKSVGEKRGCGAFGGRIGDEGESWGLRGLDRVSGVGGNGRFRG